MSDGAPEADWYDGKDPTWRLTYQPILREKLAAALAAGAAPESLVMVVVPGELRWDGKVEDLVEVARDWGSLRSMLGSVPPVRQKERRPGEVCIIRVRSGGPGATWFWTDSGQAVDLVRSTR